MAKERTYTVEEAAKFAGVTKQSIYVALKANRLTGKRTRRIWAIEESSLKAYSSSIND